jgi:hypothetical protein
MRYDEVRIELSAAGKGGFKSSLSLPNLSAIESTFVPPQGVSATALFDEWFKSFSKGRSPAMKKKLEERRRKVGESLFTALLAQAMPHLRAALFSLKLQAANGAPNGLRIRLVLGDTRGKGKKDASRLLPVSSLPFELMIDPESERFLVHHRLISLVRTLGVAQPPVPLKVSGGKLKVLIVTSRPKGESELDWEQEVGRIRAALGGRGDTMIEVLAGGSFEQTYRTLRNGFHVFHFIGHGNVDPDSGEGYLVFERGGEPDPASASEIAHRLGDIHTLRLVVLNACHSGQLPSAAGESPVSSVATALSAQGVPAVLAMQIAVTDSACVEFSGAFYGALREDPSVELALADGRSEIPISSPESATAVLYLLGATSDLFDFKPEPETAAVSSSDPSELALGVRTLVESEKFPHLADWAKKLETTTERLLPLEEYFDGRFIREPNLWSRSVLPRLNRFLARAVSEDRPLALSLAAHGTVAFAAGYYLHTKSGTKISLIQETRDGKLIWSESQGECPAAPLWQPFEEKLLNAGSADVAVAIEVSNKAFEAVEKYLAKAGVGVRRLIRAQVSGDPDLKSVKNGAHAYRLAWSLQQWLKDHAGDDPGRRLHIFFSAPNAFAFYLGQVSRPLGHIRLYEYNFEREHQKESTYEPSLDLPQATQE